jgi:hypothetical protein
MDISMKPRHGMGSWDGVLGWGPGMGSWDGVLGWGPGMGSWDGVLGWGPGMGHGCPLQISFFADFSETDISL